jgi:XTP/dITP diphosphohydrolase
LNGEPGVNSAYFAGSEGSREERDARNNAKLVELLRGTPDAPAFYYCVLVLVQSPDDAVPIVADARWQGRSRRPAQAAAASATTRTSSPRVGFTAAELDAPRRIA